MREGSGFFQFAWLKSGSMDMDVDGKGEYPSRWVGLPARFALSGRLIEGDDTQPRPGRGPGAASKLRGRRFIQARLQANTASGCF